jgi:hypothetical protein
MAAKGRVDIRVQRNPLRTSFVSTLDHRPAATTVTRTADYSSIVDAAPRAVKHMRDFYAGCLRRNTLL